MASRVFLLCILFTVGLLTGRSVGTGEPEVTLSLTREPQDVVAVRSKQLVLHCEVVSSTSDPFNVTWTHDDHPLDLVNDSRRSLLQNGSLVFKRISIKGPDQGSYRCVAHNSVGGLVSRAARLRIATLAHNFSGSPVNTSVEEDDIARFSCQIESVPEALISWERNGNPLPQSSRYFILESGVLYITRAQQEDAGTYRCIATNLLAKKLRTSKEAQLIVKPKSLFPRPPEFLSHLGSAVRVVTARTGDNLTLDCAASGSPTPQISWSFSKGKLPVAMSQIKSGPGISILPLQNISPHHTGTYTCSAHSDDATAVNQTVSLDVLVPPTFVKMPTSQFYLTARTVRFECEAQGNPTPNIIWLKNGKELQINGRIKQRTTELVVSNTVTDDSGLYQCLAVNKAGENWVAARLRVNISSFQPEPPQGLVCFTRSESQVELQWKEPAKIPDSDISAYTVHYLPTDGGEERQEVSVNRTFVVQKLAAYTNYTFYVRAYSTRSASDQSVRIVCQTGEGVPLGAPKPLLEAVSPTTLRVTWSPLSKEKAQGVVTAYKIQWRRRGHPTLRVVEVKGDITDYTITGLHPGKKFDVRVLAATNKGWPEHPEEFQWTPIEMPNYNLRNVPQAPTVHLTSDNSTSIEVKWSLPPENKYKPSGFKLFYRKIDSQQEGPVNLDANVTQYLLGYLEPETLYEVIVRAYNSEGVGEPGVKAIYTLPPSGRRVRDNVTMSLEPPSNLEAEPTSPISINLTWIPPAMLSANISYYTVKYGPVQSSRTINTSIFSYVSSTSRGVEINGLKPYTLYEFMVRTHDHNNCHGPFSQKVECHTLEDVPSAVLDIQWRALNSTSIRVSWKEPHFTNGLINNYIVSITTDFGLPFDSWRSISVPGSRLYTEISGLKPNVHYFIFARAVTRAGMGPLSQMVPLTIPVVTPPGGSPLEPPQQPRDQQPDQHLGIVVGVGIGVGCIVLCAVVIVWRRRCMKMSSPQCSSGPHHANGNGYYPPSRMMELHELDHFTANIPHEPQPDHLDTKGGYPNGQVNGLKHTRHTNGRIPNGQIVRDKGNNVHITENPQFNNGGGSVTDMRDSQDISLLASTKSCRSEEDDSDHTTPLLLFRGMETSAKESGSSEVGEACDLNTTRMTELDKSDSHLNRSNHQCTQNMDKSVASTSTSSPLQAAAPQPHNQ